MCLPSRLVLAVLLAVMFVTVAAGMGAAGGHNVANVDDENDPDNIVLEVHVTEDGTAEWTIEHRYRLGNDTDEAAFEDLAADIESEEEAYVERFTERMDGTVENAEASTGRTMSIENVSIGTETRALPREYGIVRYTFEWHGFAAVEDDRLLAGDAIGGMFLEEDSSLRVSWSDELALESAAPSPSQTDDHSVRWDGPVDFGSDEPSIALIGAEEPLIGLGSTLGFIAVALVGFGIAAGIGGWWYLGRGRSVVDTREESIEETNLELLSNEERVLHLLESEGGRLKQQEVVEELGWTDAKTSQVVSDLRDAGEIESFRLGRENVLRLLEESED